MSKSVSPLGSKFDLVLAFNRFLVGLYFFAAGIGKSKGELDNGFGSFYEGPFKGLQPDWLPDALAWPYGYALPWAEVLFGLTLMLGLFTRISAFLVGMMLISFTIALMMAKGLSGGGPGLFHPNVVMFAVCVLVMVAGTRRYTIDHNYCKRHAAKD